MALPKPSKLPNNSSQKEVYKEVFFLIDPLNLVRSTWLGKLKIVWLAFVATTVIKKRGDKNLGAARDRVEYSWISMTWIFLERSNRSRSVRKRHNKKGWK